MKSNYTGFKGWVRYVRDYKSNIKNSHQYEEYIDETSKLREQLKQEIENKKLIGQEKDNLLKLREEKIQILSNELCRAKKEIKKQITEKEIYIDEYERTQYLLDEKEKARRKYAGSIGGLKAKISVLKKDLARANQKINWLSNNQKAPTKEEILAYELQMKEVEKKLKKDID